MTQERKKRKPGTGMKPRGQVNLTATEGQDKSILEPVLERAKTEQRGVHLDPEGVQNLESVEGSNVAPSEAVLEQLSEPTEAGNDLIAELMKPADETVADSELDTEKRLDTNDDLERAIAAATSTEPELEAALGEKAPIEPPCGGIAMGKRVFSDELLASALIGEQPNGSYKAVVTIPEGYWNAINEWAASDGVKAEEWLSMRLLEIIEPYGQPAKGR